MDNVKININDNWLEFNKHGIVLSYEDEKDLDVAKQFFEMYINEEQKYEC